MNNLSNAGVFPLGAEGEGIKIAKALCKGNPFVFGEMLIAEEDHLPLQQHLAQEGVGIFIMIAQRYVVDHGPNGQPKVLKAGAKLGAQGLGRIGQGLVPLRIPPGYAQGHPVMRSARLPFWGDARWRAALARTPSGQKSMALL